MITQIYGYWIRLHWRLKETVRQLRWLNSVVDDPKCEMTDWGFMDSAKFALREPFWALLHFPDRSCAEDWIRHFRPRALRKER